MTTDMDRESPDDQLVDQRLRLALEASGMGTFLWYPEEDRTEADARMLELFGLPADGSISLASALASLIHPDDVGRYAEAVAGAADRNGSGELSEEIRVLQPDGSTRWLLVAARMAFSDEGKPLRLAGVISDMTARRVAEDALRRSDQHQSFLLALADSLRSESDPATIAGLACEQLAGFLGVDRLCYGELDDDAEQVTMLGEWPGDPASGGALVPLRKLCAAPDVLRAGRPVLNVGDAGAAEVAGVGSAAMPIIRRGRLVAGLFAEQRSSRGWTSDQRTLLMEVAMRTWDAVERGRAQQQAALERSRRYRRERQISIRLQDSLKAGHKQPPPGFTASQGYRPGLDDMRVGGDWTDLVILDDGRLALTVGDVVGKGIDAAATMGRLRSALAAILFGNQSPGATIDWLERYAAKVAGARYATVALAIIDPHASTLAYSCAGHPPPLIADERGVRYLWQARSTPLYAGESAPRPAAVEEVTRPCTVVLYTDGLVERRGEPLDVGLDRLAAVVEEHRDLSVDSLRDAILNALLDTDASHHDDTAIVIARLEPHPPLRVAADR
jgi:PAS domain S-box-containing protein